MYGSKKGASLNTAEITAQREKMDDYDEVTLSDKACYKAQTAAWLDWGSPYQARPGDGLRRRADALLNEVRILQNLAHALDTTPDGKEIAAYLMKNSIP